MTQSSSIPVAGRTTAPQRYVFLLLEQFSQLSFSGAIEALRMANGFQDRELFDWLVLSEDGNPVTASNGIATVAQGALCNLNRRDRLIVVGGNNVAQHCSDQVLNWLRREARKGVSCGAVSSGTYALALAGLLTGRMATTHWDYHNSFGERFPAVDLQDTLYVVDGNRFTSAGCAASMDMMLHLIAEDHGRDLTNYVADKMVYAGPRAETTNQRLSIHVHSGVRHTKFAEAVDIMSDHIEEPLSPATVAEMVGLSGRQLERLFRKHLSTTPKSYYTGLRLQKARELLFQTNLSLSEICFACGFNSQTHFSKSYRQRFGVTPSNDDGKYAS